MGRGQQKPRTVDDDSPVETDHAAKLYTAWKQSALTGSPARSTQVEDDKTSPKRARGSRERRTLEPGGSQSSSTCSSDEHRTDMTDHT